MSIPVFEKIRRENMPDAPKWLDFIIKPFNNFADRVYRLFNKGITFDDNIASDTVKLPDFTTNDLPLSLSNKLSKVPDGVQLLKCTVSNVGSFQIIGKAVMPEWEYVGEDNQVIIRNFTNLTAGTKYDIIVRIT